MNQDDFYFYVLLPFVKKHKSACEAARKLRLSKSYFSKVMNGKVPVSKTVAKRLGYSIKREVTFTLALGQKGTK